LFAVASPLRSKDDGWGLQSGVLDSSQADGAAFTGLADRVDAQMSLRVVKQFGFALRQQSAELGAGDAALIDRLLDAFAKTQQDVTEAQTDGTTGDIISDKVEHEASGGFEGDNEKSRSFESTSRNVRERLHSG